MITLVKLYLSYNPPPHPTTKRTYPFTLNKDTSYFCTDNKSLKTADSDIFHSKSLLYGYESFNSLTHLLGIIIYARYYHVKTIPLKSFHKQIIFQILETPWCIFHFIELSMELATILKSLFEGVLVHHISDFCPQIMLIVSMKDFQHLNINSSIYHRWVRRV